MARSRRRVSRVLILLLGLALAVGLFAEFRHGRKSAPAAAAPAAPAASETALVQIVPTVQMNAAMSRSNPPATMPADAPGASASNAPAAGSSSNTPAGWSRFAALIDQTNSNLANSAARAPSAAPPILTSTPPVPAPATAPAVAHAPDLEAAHIRQVALTTPPAADNAALSDSDAMARAKTLADTGDLVDARAALNDQLIGGKLSAAEAAAMKKQISQWNETLVFSPRTAPGDPYMTSVLVKSGDNMSKIASDHDTTWELLSRINGVTPQKMRAGSALKVVVGPFHAVVSKTAFTIDLYLGAPGGKGSMYIKTFPVGLGKDDSTPPGTWMVELHKKIKNPTYYSPRGEGVIEAGDPKNPLGPFWIGLTGIDGQAVGQQSYGIHGTIDPDSIGKQSSMGCIRLHNEDVAVVYEMMVEGKSLVIVTP